MQQYPKLFSPKRLKSEDIQCQTLINLGQCDTKPSLGVLNDREMVVFTHHSHYEHPDHRSPAQKDKHLQIYHTVMYRTEDGGKTWFSCGHMPFDGHEPSVTVIDGVLFVHTHAFPTLASDHDLVTAHIYRSEDQGKTWECTHIDSACVGFRCNTCMNRNFIRLRDGSVAGFVTAYTKTRSEVLRVVSYDMGKTWTCAPVAEALKLIENSSYRSLVEGVFFRSRAGRLMAITRIDWSCVLPEQKAQIPGADVQSNAADIDQSDCMLLMASDDEGLTWTPLRGLGYSSMMYPSIVYLNDRDILLTYTKRDASKPSPYHHFGVQAILGRENEDGSFDFDFDHDIIVLEDHIPDYSAEAGGYGRTFQLSDGSLVTPYSYRINSAEFDRLIQSDDFTRDEVFEAYYENSKLLGNCPSAEYYRQGSFELKKHLIHLFALERMQTRYVSDFIRWRVRLPQED